MTEIASAVSYVVASGAKPSFAVANYQKKNTKKKYKSHTKKGLRQGLGRGEQLKASEKNRISKRKNVKK